MSDSLLAILHLCDSLFPVGTFAYSDGLEAAVRLAPAGSPLWRASPAAVEAAAGTTDVVDFLREWMDVTLAEPIGRLDGPAVWSAWRACTEEDWVALTALDEDLTALRPSLAARRSIRAVGLRLLNTWTILHPDARLERVLAHARAGPLAPTLPVAFAVVCACAGLGRHESVAAFAYTRLAAATSAAMRLLPIGQTDAHGLLARALDRVPGIVDAVARRDARPESFAPALDIACMSQQYLHSRLFRS